jgi:chloramphenicol 3-O-phosphotransferase
LPDFIVEGERDYWMHVAIDRFTEQVLDKQIEVVNE